MFKKEEIDEILSKDLNYLLNNKLIYHFSSFETALNEIILKQTLKFSNPESFNDPFDCNENLLKVNISKESIEKVFKEIPNNFSQQQKEKMFKELLNPKIISETLKKKKKEYKISCFSKIYDEVLMWSHYADKHNGICVGFNFKYENYGKFILCPIKYIDEIKSFDEEIEVNSIIMYWLTNKSKRWSYEEEVRAIAKSQNNEDKEFIDYDKKDIKEIIFGCNVTEENVNLAIKKIKDSGIFNDVIIYKKMEIDTETFLLKEKLIKPIA